MTFESWFSNRHSEISVSSCKAVLKLTEAGATVPFIARYRKEQTSNLDEVAIQQVVDAKEEWDKITQRQAFILGEIENQKKLTPELKEKISSTFELNLLEDLYLPYKQKRKTKAALAREAGLQPLADWIWDCGHGTATPEPGQTLELWAFTFRNEAKDVKDVEAAIQGAQDILIERLSETLELRQKVRDALFQRGCVGTKKGEKAKSDSKFENYFSYHEKIEALLVPQNSHRYLAMRRGWMEEELVLTLGGPPDQDGEFEAELLQAFEVEACTIHESVGAVVLLKAAKLAYRAHVFPSIEGEAHKALKAVADDVAIHVFAENVRKLLLAAPFGPKAVLGIDPGIKTGCKLAVVDDAGKYLGSTVIHLQSDQEKQNAKVLLGEIVKNGTVRAIAVGNGTAGRETEHFVRTTVKELDSPIPVVMVSEAGASVYSASEAAREEFPDLDVTIRGAISIARRLQDPLAELVKTDPKSIGVGQYQHDVSPHALKRSLDFVVDSCVNSVGVAINTASHHLLAHVAGIGPGLAKSIVEYRGQKGLFKSRAGLLEVPRFSKKTFEQAAGFLRIPDGENPLDNTGVHPESYPVLEGLASEMGRKVQDFMGSGVVELKKRADLREKLGSFTFDDIIQELEKPGRDSREEFVPFQFRDDIHEVKDLKPGMLCPGIVTNVTNFGAFVDIGVHQDGLVHISQLAQKFVKDPREVVSVGDRVQVKVLEANLEKKQISLSMKVQEKPKHQERPRQERQKVAHNRPRPERKHLPMPIKELPKVSAKGKRIKPAEVFNNAFSALAAMKKDLKPGK